MILRPYNLLTFDALYKRLTLIYDMCTYPDNIESISIWRQGKHFKKFGRQGKYFQKFGRQGNYFQKFGCQGKYMKTFGLQGKHRYMQTWRNITSKFSLYKCHTLDISTISQGEENCWSISPNNLEKVSPTFLHRIIMVTCGRLNYETLGRSNTFTVWPELVVV